MSKNDFWHFGYHINSWGERIPVGMPFGDLRTHALALGTTGSGKSTALRNLALQAFNKGMATIVIEPKGDLCLDPTEGILASVPSDQLDRVTVLDLASHMPPQIPLLTFAGSDGRSSAVDAAMRVIHIAESASWGGAVRMRELLENALHLILAAKKEQAAMVHLHKFLNDGEYREGIIEDAAADEEAYEPYIFWRNQHNRMAAMSDEGESILEVPRRRVSLFMRDARFRRSLALPVLSSETAFDLADVMNSNRMVLIPLQKAKLGDKAVRVFGTLFMQMVAYSAFARANVPVAERKQVLVIIDEFSEYSGDQLSEIFELLLKMARAFGLSLVLATQGLGQIKSRDLLGELDRNISTKLILMTEGETDAKLARSMLAHPKLKPLDIQNIEKYHGYARVKVRQESQPAFYFQSLQPVTFASNSAEFAPPSAQNFSAEPSNLVTHYHTLDATDAAKKAARLTPSDFEKLIRAQVIFGRNGAEKLAQNPALVPGQVDRALAISRAENGLPTWLYEAQYQRARRAK